MPDVTNKGVQKLEMTKGGGFRVSLFTFFPQKSSNVPIFSLCNGLVLGLILIILVEILHFDLSPSNVCEALKNNNQNLMSSRQFVQTF